MGLLVHTYHRGLAPFSRRRSESGDETSHCNPGTQILKCLKDLDTTGIFVHPFSSVSITSEEERDSDDLLLCSFCQPQKSFQDLSAFLKPNKFHLVLSCIHAQHLLVEDLLLGSR